MTADGKHHQGDTSKVDLYRPYGALYALPLMASL